MRTPRALSRLTVALGLALAVPAVAALPAQAGLLRPPVCTPLVCPAPPTSTDTTSLDDVRAVLGADGLTADGTGVDVAVIDTGITPVGPLAGQVLNGPDLSFDSGRDELRHLDGYGHGTHMAGILNAVAPGARLVNVKVGDATGRVDVTQVIAALDWVVEHRDSGDLDVRVVNLAMSMDSRLPARLNPLNAAVDRAWRAGVVVVAAAGNDGRGDYRLSAPASSPSSIAVGAADTLGSRDRSTAVAADFSAYGGIERRPDLLAPGARVASLRVPGSVLDTENPTARRGEALFRGSGTSQAAAAVSGAAALLLQQRPGLSPAQVRALLRSSADRLPRSALVGGAGLVDVAGAARARVPAVLPALVPVLGTGSLQAARGDAVLSLMGKPLLGEVDVTGRPFDVVAWRLRALTQGTWSGGSWHGQSWSGGSWSGQSWSGQSWSGQSWSGQSWSGQSWSGQSWSGQSWSGQSWSGDAWG